MGRSGIPKSNGRRKAEWKAGRRKLCHLYGCIWSKYLIRLGGANVQTSLIRMTAKSSVTNRGTESVNIFIVYFIFS
jgi:hypothetical protein